MLWRSDFRREHTSYTVAQANVYYIPEVRASIEYEINKKLHKQYRIKKIQINYLD